jgi:hypothetical protein
MTNNISIQIQTKKHFVSIYMYLKGGMCICPFDLEPKCLVCMCTHIHSVHFYAVTSYFDAHAHVSACCATQVGVDFDLTRD